jgi:hypothetical protein
MRLPRTHRLSLESLFFGAIFGGFAALVLLGCQGCTVTQHIDRYAHELVDEYCDRLTQAERRLFRARFNATSAHRVSVPCEGDVRS